MKELRFPKGFYFGGATAAYQCGGTTRENGKGEVVWDKYLCEQGTINPDLTCDFYHRCPEDLELCKEFHTNTIRVSIDWAGIFPEGGGRTEPRGVGCYHKLFKKCHEEGVEPFITLHHFDTPQALRGKGGWLSQEVPDAFIEYAKFCFKEYAGEARYWIAINGPTSVADQQYVDGTSPPAYKDQLDKCFKTEYNQSLVHARIVNAYKEAGHTGQIGIVHALQTVHPATGSEGDKHTIELKDVLENKFYLDGTLAGKYSKHTLALVREIIDANGQQMVDIKPEDEEVLLKAAKRLDFVGINYYFSRFMKEYRGDAETIRNGTDEKGTDVNRMKNVGEEIYPKDLPATDWDWITYPQEMYDQLKRVYDDYPLARSACITENGVDYKDKFEGKDKITDDASRIDYLKQHMEKVAKAVEAGIPVNGYFVWPLQDISSWTNGCSKRYGLFYVNFKTQKRHAEKSTYWYKKLVETQEIPPVD